MSVSTSTPSVAELRAATQPASIFERNSGEHWAGRLYMRRLSPYLTRLLIRTPITPNAATALMTVAGLVAAAVLTLPGVWAALGAVLLIQLQLLLDCADGELARWRRRDAPAGGSGSAVGIYLDRIAHYLTETALPVALGIRADGGWDALGGWTTLGLVAALLQLIVKAETALVHVARAEAGMPLVLDRREVAAPRASGLARVRRMLGFLPFYRAFVAMEFTLLALVAAVVDAVAGNLDGTRVLLVGLIAAGAVTAAGHLAAILTSSSLR